jgi:protein transport protein SEC31
MNELAVNIQAKQYDAAVAIFSDLMTNKTEEGSNWMVSLYRTCCGLDKILIYNQVGVKRLIQFSKSTA